MNSKKLPFMAACLSVATGLVALNLAVADNMSVGIPALPDGITAKDLNSDKAIEKSFKAVTEYSLDKTGFDNLVNCLVEQDRDRISKSLASGTLNNINGSKNQKFTDVIASIDGAWKQKYNQKFSIDITKVYNADFIHIQTGEVADPDLLVGKWPVQVSLMSGTAGALAQADADQAKNKMFGGEVKLEKGRHVALVQFQTSAAFSGLNASMIKEVGGGWKFDVPNTLTVQKLYDNVVNNLTTLDQQRDQWPADINEAYRRFTQAVVAAIYDAPYPGDILHRQAGASAGN